MGNCDAFLYSTCSLFEFFLKNVFFFFFDIFHRWHFLCPLSLSHSPFYVAASVAAPFSLSFWDVCLHCDIHAWHSVHDPIRLCVSLIASASRLLQDTRECKAIPNCCFVTLMSVRPSVRRRRRRLFLLATRKWNIATNKFPNGMTSFTTNEEKCKREKIVRMDQ